MTNPRQGRGAGNGHNENYRNSQFWDSVKKKQDKQKQEKE